MAEEKKLVRKTSDKVIAGVCSGLAEYFGMDVMLMRILFVAVGFFTGLSIPLYIILWIIAPEEGAEVA